MYEKRVDRAIGACLLAALTLAGCGSTGTGTHASGTAPSSSKGKGSAASGAKAWRGGQVWGNLTKLQNFSLQSKIVIGGTGGAGESVNFTEEQYSPTNYTMTMETAGSTQGTTIILAGGHYYWETGTEVMDMGTSAQGLGATYASLTSSWQGWFQSSDATYAGPCSAAGRSGNEFRLSASLPYGGVNESVKGNACLDQQTGAPLSTYLKWTLSSGGKSMSFEDSLQVTGIGNVAPIPAPKGATAPGSGG